MKKLIMFFKNAWYFLRCWFVRNPNNPEAPRLWDLKPGTKFKVLLYGKLNGSYVIVRVFWHITKYDGALKFKAEVQDSQGKLDEIYLTDQGVVPYHHGWNGGNVPYLLD